jgi:predicted TIM-barrel fold metal-dependent hydrolase
MEAQDSAMAIFDSHAYLADNAFTHAMASPQAVLETMRRYQMTAVALVSGMAADCDFVTGNQHLREILDPDAGLFGYVTLNAGYPAESMEEQRRHLTRRQFVAGLLFGHDGLPVNLADARDILNAQRRYAKPMAIHAPDAAAVLAVREIAAEFPSMKFVLMTMGGDDWHYAVVAAKQHVNLYLEISGSLDSDKIDHATSVLTARKLLYGSGLPYDDPQLTIGLVEDAGTLTVHDRGRIYSQNALGLYSTQRDLEL